MAAQGTAQPHDVLCYRWPKPPNPPPVAACLEKLSSLTPPGLIPSCSIPRNTCSRTVAATP